MFWQVPSITDQNVCNVFCKLNCGTHKGHNFVICREVIGQENAVEFASRTKERDFLVNNYEPLAFENINYITSGETSEKYVRSYLFQLPKKQQVIFFQYIIDPFHMDMTHSKRMRKTATNHLTKASQMNFPALLFYIHCNKALNNAGRRSIHCWALYNTPDYYLKST